MLTIQVLEKDDVVLITDYFRPLRRSADYSSYSDNWCPINSYSGRPEDHLKWVPVSDCWGTNWNSRTVKEFCKLREYEFIRGVIPKSHILKWKDRDDD